MIKIPLTRGLTAIVDDEDADLAELKWCASSKGYAVRFCRQAKKRTLESMHRTVLERVIDRKLSHDEECDHINGCKSDNRRMNLRIANHSQNMSNKPVSSNNKSGYKGVYWNRTDKRWVAQIKIRNKRIHIGHFRDLIEAAHAYDSAAIMHHGEFAKLNFLGGDKGSPA